MDSHKLLNNDELYKRLSSWVLSPSSAPEPDWYRDFRQIWSRACEHGNHALIVYLFEALQKLFWGISTKIRGFAELKRCLAKREDDYEKIAKILKVNGRIHFPIRLSDFLHEIINENVVESDKNSGEKTPLFFAVKQDHFPLIDTLLKYGARVNVEKYPEGETTLSYAIFHGKIELIQYLMLLVSDPTHPRYLAFALGSKRNDVIQIFIDKGILPFLEDLKELNLSEDSEQLRLLLQGDPRLERTQQRFYIVAQYAIEKDFLDLWNMLNSLSLQVDYYLYEKIKLASCNEIFKQVFMPNEETSCLGLKLAIENNNQPLAKRFLDVDLSLVNKINPQDSRPPLLIACEKGFIDLAKYLLHRGADVNGRGPYDITPLMVAVAREDENLILILLWNYHANLDLKNSAGRNVFEIASELRLEKSHALLIPKRKQPVISPAKKKTVEPKKARISSEEKLSIDYLLNNNCSPIYGNRNKTEEEEPRIIQLSLNRDN